ncbi:hypothetical protein [Komagataeibacter swingsii]|uniref:Uncharacterized protein n=1 Tax=Komagataeibacter swingsii TaxID=215220 RepID=A0A850NZA7_9PROT|nr:hypothetical protein [Komagataeibacter swingsii]NVN37727.1 hypothetical protein [Komagataeibacter swingsii]
MSEDRERSEKSEGEGEGEGEGWIKGRTSRIGWGGDFPGFLKFYREVRGFPAPRDKVSSH